MKNASSLLVVLTFAVAVLAACSNPGGTPLASAPVYTPIPSTNVMPSPSGGLPDSTALPDYTALPDIPGGGGAGPTVQVPPS